MTPAPEFMASLEGTDLEKTIHLANKQLKTGTKYEIIDDSVDLSDRSLRTAWEYVAGENERASEDLNEDDLAKYNMKENKKETI